MYEEGARSTAVPPLDARLVDIFLDHTDDVVLMFEGDGTITWASPSSQRVFGVRPAELLGHNGMDMIHPDDQDRAFSAVSSIPSVGDTTRVELRIIDPAGRIRWVEEVVTNLLDEPGVGGVVGHLRDITERKEVERAVLFQASLLDAVGQAVAARDTDGVVIYWNEAAAGLFGWTAEEALGRPMRELIVPVDAQRAVAQREDVEHLAGRRYSGAVDVIGKDGLPIPILVTAAPVHDEAGRLVATIAVATDLTDTIAAQRRAEEDHRRLADAQASAHLGSFELDLATGELLGSDELWRILGRPPGRLDRLEHVHPEDRDRFLRALAEATEGRNDVACTHRIVRPDGVVRWVVSRSSQFHSSASRILSGTMLDITQRHEAERALLHQATHDPLTGLANRRLFVDRLEAALDAESAGAGATAVLFVDLDDFGSVNERIGHVDGDGVLRQLGERIAGTVPAGATVGRLGGDEFVICVPCGGAQAAVAVASAVQDAIRRPTVVGGTTLALDSSVGVALSGPGRQAEALLRHADMAMYAAKQAGRGRCEVFDDALHDREARRADLVVEMRAALDSGQIVAHFQPEFELATGTLFGFEALARWVHPERGVIGPDVFIPLAEEAGLIGALGGQMLVSACRAVARWRERRPDLALTVGVNVSPLQLADPSFPGQVEEALRSWGVPPACVCIEVTESTLMDVAVASDAPRRLTDTGVQVAIDDFGTGYSSFSRLKHFPVRFLKIDQSFVFDIGLRPEDDVIVTTMARMARSLGVEVIAEGIETEAQRTFLAAAGCEYGQGYLWSRPVEEGAATALVDAHPRSADA
ncbi:EAL domain-containing protein [Iamia sp. SCSIO 61187]|uniref:bifunctional diguanylate cyclase/phosphodiesterase n=1 Tax=Iamia sp. SCSIO 61187 TaxID=2722752 RepID=UPI001C631B75|nr:bifunctional diguanylate cyclase/phosphodiesterase [Iamia sp. SCSIO 61187]QYG93173.1 EAL domain-containing protein [Iamia sp. SCSIO 61187]